MLIRTARREDARADKVVKGLLQLAASDEKHLERERTFEMLRQTIRRLTALGLDPSRFRSERET